MNGRAILTILVSVAAGSLLICAGVAFLGHRYLMHFRPNLPPVPPALVTGGVTDGADFLEKRLAFSDSGIGTVTDLIGNPAADTELGIAGTEGAAFIDAAGSVKSRVVFPSRPRDVRFVDVDDDGTCEFLNRGGAGWGDASLMDQSGTTLWTHGGMPGVNGMVAGDLDKDGTLDFVVGLNGWGGVKRLDKSGNVIWTQADGNVWHVEIIDVDGDGVSEIVHSNAGGQLTLRDPQGKVIRQTRPSAYLSQFTLCRWPDEKGSAHLVAIRDDKLRIMDFHGKTVAEFDTPDAGDFGDVSATVVRLRETEPAYFAVLVHISLWNTSVLHVFDDARHLVYKEVIKDQCSAMLAVPRDDTPAQDLLVGGTGQVWCYSAKGEEKSDP